MAKTATEMSNLFLFKVLMYHEDEKSDEICKGIWALA